jgi:hypothetical protein
MLAWGFLCSLIIDSTMMLRPGPINNPAEINVRRFVYG